MKKEFVIPEELANRLFSTIVETYECATGEKMEREAFEYVTDAFSNALEYVLNGTLHVDTDEDDELVDELEDESLADMVGNHIIDFGLAEGKRPIDIIRDVYDAGLRMGLDEDEARDGAKAIRDLLRKRKLIA